MNFKHIHIGRVIQEQVALQQIQMPRICKFLKVEEEEIEAMYEKESLEASLLLRWSKLLKLNLFLYYHNHILLYTSIGAKIGYDRKKEVSITNPPFRKNIYTQEIKEHMVNLILKKGKTAIELSQHYKIPVNTLYKWLKKWNTQEAKQKKSSRNSPPPDYKRIFEDLAHERYGGAVPEVLQQKIAHLDSAVAVWECNQLLFEKDYTSKETARMKSYDKASIMHILKTQQEEKLNDTELAKRFHMSRNTIAKWKKQYNS